MKVVIAPDSFKESLPAADVARAVAEGVLEVWPDAQVDLCPMADGGEGTVEAMVAATGGRMLCADVFDPLGSPRRVHLGLLGKATHAGLPGQLGLLGAVVAAAGESDAVETAEGGVAVVEMAQASGLMLVGPDRRDPLRTTTYGTGQLILAALDAGAREIIVGIGGSATVDGGCGCAQALGVTFLDDEGNACVCGLAGGGLSGIGRIDVSSRDGRLAQTKIRVACDVTNPLTGAQGAAAVFGPQKGATPEMVVQLEAGLNHLAQVIRRDLGLDVSVLAGAGAAGGLGAGLVAFAGATIESGFDIVAQAVGLSRRLADADVVITGEGKLDGQSRAGKTAVGVAGMARTAGAPALCIAGQVSPDAPRELFAGVWSLVSQEVKLSQAMQHTAALIKQRTIEAIRSIQQ